MFLIVKLLLLLWLFATRPPVHSVTLELTHLDNDSSSTKLSYFVSSTMSIFDVKDDQEVDMVTFDGFKVWNCTDGAEKLQSAKVIYNEFGARVVLLTTKQKYSKLELYCYLNTLNGWVLLNSVNPFNISLLETDTKSDDNTKGVVTKVDSTSTEVTKDTSTTTGTTPETNTSDSTSSDVGEVRVDLANVPEPPMCRRCSYVVDGILYSIHYFHSGNKYNKLFYEGKMFYQLPKGKQLAGSCIYMRNSKPIFIDLLLSKPEKSNFVYFELTESGFAKISREEFKEKLQKYKTVPTTVDLSKSYSKTYTTNNSTRFNRTRGEGISKVDCMLYTPNDGYVIRKVVDGELSVVESENDILEVRYYNLGGQKLLSMIFQEGPNFQYKYYTYFGDLGKWSASSEYFYYKLIDEYVKSEGKYSIDLKNTLSSKYLLVQKDSFLHQLNFLPNSSSLVNAVYDHGRLIWTARKPNETCIFVWYQFQYNLLYLVSKIDGEHANYYYQKNGHSWTYIVHEEFRRRFSFIFSTNDVLDLKNNLFGFDVKENGNAFTVQPRHFHLIGKVTYGTSVVWSSSSSLKCYSAKIIYDTNATNVYLYLKDYEGNSYTKLYKTLDNDLTKLELSYSETGNLEEVGTLPTSETKVEKSENADEKLDKNKESDTVTVIPKGVDPEEVFDTVENTVVDTANVDKVDTVVDKVDNKVDTSDKVDAAADTADTSDKVDTDTPVTEDSVKTSDESVKQETSYTSFAKKEYDKVVDTWNTFNNVYNPETSDKPEETVKHLGVDPEESLFETDTTHKEAVEKEKSDKKADVEEKELVKEVDEYLGGMLDIQKMKSTKFGDFVDARNHGLNYLLFTPRPGYPVRYLRDGFETIWKSHSKECVALSVFLKDGAPFMLELFVKCSVEVSRHFFQLRHNRWHPVGSHEYDILTNSL
uniref:SfiI-subtelomeric related protein family member n=1 Tax=Theileria annulata TaxID=5874 RepID=A0A3B0MI95_THEAN